MIIVSVILMSAIDGSSTELARMGIDNASGGGRVRDYNCRTWRGRDTDALNRAMVADNVTRKGKVEGHRSLDLHVWHLVAKALAAMGYGPATPVEITGGEPEILLTRAAPVERFEEEYHGIGGTEQ